MTISELNVSVDETITTIRSLLGTKGAAYSANDTDRAANIKRLARMADITTLQAWLVLCGKHLDVIIRRLANAGEIYTSEDMEERINDVLVYLILLKGLLADSGNDLTPRPQPEKHLFQAEMAIGFGKMKNPAGGKKQSRSLDDAPEWEEER
jgi:hypothetical protein